MNWLVILPVSLGFASIFLLLPRPRPFPMAFGLLGLVATLVAFAAYGVGSFGGPQYLSVEAILFYSFASMTILFAMLMIIQRNPARCAICFASVVLNVCGLFLLQAAPFLMAATIIVYAGAIIVTFLFVIMLAQQSGYGHTNANDRSREAFLAPLTGFILLGILFIVLQRAYNSELPMMTDRVQAVAAVESVPDAVKLIGDPQVFFQKVQTSVERHRPDPFSGRDDPYTNQIREQLEQLVPAIDEAAFAIKPDSLDVKPVQAAFGRLSERMARFQQTLNDPTIAASDITLSNYSRAVRLNPDGAVVAAGLPAANVSAIGRSMFSDHLLAIEMAGTLLLVATIGAILIGGQRSKEQA